MKRFKKILFVKSTEQNEGALAHALALAKRNQAVLTVMATPEEIPDITDDGFTNDLIREAKRAALAGYREDLEQLAAPLREEIQVETELVEGRPFLTIIREVLRNGHDLVIKSTDGSEGLLSRVFSSNDMHLLRKCPCPVWLVRPGRAETIKRIVAAVDFDELGEKDENKALNRQILEMAISLAHREKAELHVVHAWQAIGEDALRGVRSNLSAQQVEDYILDVKASREHRLAELMSEAQEWVDPELFEAVKTRVHAIKGQARQVVAEQTRALDADLIVMGTVGRTGIAGFFIGNTAESILNQLDCSVLAVKPAGFVSPVKLP